MKQRLLIVLVFLAVVTLARAFRRSHSHRWRSHEKRYRAIRHSRHNYHHNSEDRRLSSRHRKLRQHNRRRKSKQHTQHLKRHRAHKGTTGRHLKSEKNLHTKETRRKLVDHKHKTMSAKKDRQLDYPNLPGSEYKNPFREPPVSVDSQTDNILNYHQGPNMGGSLLLQSSLFLRDGNYTKYIRDLYRKGQLKIVQRDFSKIDENYFEGTTAYIGDRHMPDDFAVAEMNFEQYKHHLLMTMTADREDMKYLKRYNDEILMQNLMLNLRDTRDRIYQSNLDMENEIYREIGRIHKQQRQKDIEFRKVQQEQTRQMQARTLGKPFYLSNPDKFDIFSE